MGEVAAYHLGISQTEQPENNVPKISDYLEILVLNDSRPAKMPVKEVCTWFPISRSAGSAVRNRTRNKCSGPSLLYFWPIICPYYACKVDISVNYASIGTVKGCWDVSLN